MVRVRVTLASRVAFVLLAVTVVTVPVAAQEECYDEAFCLEGVPDQEGGIDIRVRNLLYGAITMRLDLEMENLGTASGLPMVVTIPGTGTLDAIHLSIGNRREGWSYRFDAQWIFGTLEPRHQDGTVYTLPYDQGDSWMVGQGYNGNTTHRGKYALDFDLPEGTDVRATRPGIVIETEGRFEVGGPDQSLKTRANFVKIQHADGTIANYVHLKHRGIRVLEGQQIRVGQLLGISGNTGFTTGPHLHFEVYGIGPDLDRRTLPVRFQTENGPRELEAGVRYKNPGSR